MKNQNTWENYSEEQVKACTDFCEGYKDFLSQCKTERECVTRIRKDIEAAGYRPLSKFISAGRRPAKGDKLYAVNMDKAVVMFNMGSAPLEEGMNILGAHIDSPRMDVKQNPLYEDGGFAYLDTHYYGGIKKYQWVTLPLAIHGVVMNKEGQKIEISIGEKENDPVFFVSDLLIHLAQEQMTKEAAKVIEGEALDIIIGNRPIVCDKTAEAAEGKADADARGAVERAVMEIMKKEYGFEEEDFISAELEVVPAGRARDAGLDRSMILSYGQDDRVCAYSSYQAMLEVADVERTACCILVDKEEIGSVGATGMESKFFENAVAEVIGLCGDYNELKLKRCLAACTMLSSDVSSAFDPTYAASFDKKNVAFLGCGMVLNKFTGARGKSGSNDANAEYLSQLRQIFAAENVNFQTAELGKVDLGGGGTIAYILALYGMNVIDSGVAVLNMHSPWEATSKADVYETKRGYEAFLRLAAGIK
jgi:aspartyl aminopeptidase